MAKKIEVTITDKDDDIVTKFYTKNLTKVVNKLPAGTTLKVFFQENKFGKQYVGNYVTKSPPGEPEEPPVITCPENQHEENGVCVPDVIPEPDHECPDHQHWDDAAQKCVPDEVEPPTCPPGQHLENGVCVPDTPPPPPPPTGNEIFNSRRDTKLHDGKTRTIKREGDIAPGKLGVECRASGDPEIQVHADQTFSLVSGSGGVENFSTKLRSRHNEEGECEKRFGGLGCHIDNSIVGMKIEKCHNIHESGTEKSHGVNLNDGNYHTLEFQVKDVSDGIEQIAWVDGTEKLKRTKTSPPAYYTDKASFARQSYFWLRLNNSDHGRIYVYALNYNAKLKAVFKFDASNNAIRFKEVILTAV